MSTDVRPTLGEAVEDLWCTIHLALRGVHADEESHILVPIWELRLLLEAAEVSVPMAERWHQGQGARGAGTEAAGSRLTGEARRDTTPAGPSWTSGGGR